MDNENIYDAAYSETQVIEENETKHNFNQEQKKEKRKKKSMIKNIDTEEKEKRW